MVVELLIPLHLPGEVTLYVYDARVALPQKKVQTLIGLQAEFEK